MVNTVSDRDNSFDKAWQLIGKMAWKPDQVEHDGLWGDQQGPHPEPLDAGLYRPSYAQRDPDWFHEHKFKETGKKLNQWTRHQDQDWALNPFIQDFIPHKEQREKPVGEREAWQDRGGRYIQVDRMMKPLLEALRARGIKTKFSDAGGDLIGRNPNYDHLEELKEKSIFGGGHQHPQHEQQGYLWFGDEGVPDEIKHFPNDKDVSYKKWLIDHEQAVNSPLIDDNGETVRWQPRENMAQLRQLYDAFGVAFPEEHMEGGKYLWR